MKQNFTWYVLRCFEEEHRLRVVANSCNPRPREAEAGGPQVWGQPRLQNEFLSLKAKGLRCETEVVKLMLTMCEALSSIPSSELYPQHWRGRHTKKSQSSCRMIEPRLIFQEEKAMFHSLFPSAGCGGKLTTSTGLFTSPNYPMPYYHSSECYWWLEASHGSPFLLEFQDFHLEHHPNCSLDYLAVCIMSLCAVWCSPLTQYTRCI